MTDIRQVDCLEGLRLLGAGSVDLIATDPPYCSGNDFNAYDDKWPSIEAYVEYMQPRAVEMRRVLKDTGSLYWQCDPTASHYIKVMLDGVFGREQFRNEIVWCYAPGGRPPSKSWHRKHDVILYYGKTDGGSINRQYTALTEKAKSKFWKTDADGRRYKAFPNGRTYLDQSQGRPVPDWWADIPALGQTMSKEMTGYPTQKPLALYERIIRASSDEGDVVCDPFCGSGTTLVAAHMLGRKCIGMDIGADAVQTSLARCGHQYRRAA